MHLNRSVGTPSIETGLGWWTGVATWLELFKFLLLPNAIFWLLGSVVHSGRAAVNLDYLAVGAVASLLPLWCARSLVAVVFSLDFLFVAAAVYYFTPHHFLITATSLPSDFIVPVAVVSVLVVVTGLGLAFLLFPPGQKPRSVRGSLLVAILVLGVADAAWGATRIGNAKQIQDGEVESPSWNVATSGLLLTMLELSDIFRPRFSQQRVHSGTAQLWQDLRSQSLGGTSEAEDSEAEDIVLVLVESLGVFRDDQLDQMLRARLMTPELQDRYRVSTRNVPAHGATTSGELRELCGRRMDFRDALNVSLKDCLPNHLRSAGYRTTALHGYTRLFFNRVSWYPDLGFDDILFMEDLAPMFPDRRCGGIRGICDYDVATVVARKLQRGAPGQKQFIYWLTLSSHLPVDGEWTGPSSFECGLSHLTLQRPEICTLVRIWDDLFADIRRIALTPGLPPTRFIIVGDHAPPFVRTSDRELFIPETVPVIEMVPLASAESSGP